MARKVSLIVFVPIELAGFSHLIKRTLNVHTIQGFCCGAAGRMPFGRSRGRLLLGRFHRRKLLGKSPSVVLKQPAQALRVARS